MVKENPYRLADDIWGIGFRTADTIASKLGFEKDAYARFRGGLMYTLNRLAEDGHCYALREQLTETGSELLEVPKEILSPALDRMIAAKDVITAPVPDTEDLAIYLPPFFYAEVGVQNRMRGIAAGEAAVPQPAQVSMREDIEYDEVQLQAIRTADYLRHLRI